MADPADRSQLLEQALASAKAGDALAALQHLIAAWRVAAAEPIARAVDEVGRAVARGRWPAGSDGKPGAQAQWMEVAARRNPADLSLLLETLWSGAKLGQARKRLSALLQYAPDPRLFPALMEGLEEPPCDVTGQDVEFFWADFFEVLKAADDPRMPPLADRLLERTGRRDPEWAIRERAAALVPSRQLEPLGPEDVARCKAIVAALEIGAGQKTEEGFLREIFERPGDDELRQVYADWLSERGDPRGEFIALQYARCSGRQTPAQAARARELLALHGRRWLGSLVSKVDVFSAVFERGFPSDVEATDEPDDAPAWATISTLRGAVPGDGTPALSLVRIRDLTDLRAFHRRTLPLPIEELHWKAGAAVTLATHRAQLDRLPPLPALRRLDLSGGFAGETPAFFEWIWRSPLGAHLDALVLTSAPTRLADWLAMMDAHRLYELDLALTGSGRMMIVNGSGGRGALFYRDVARSWTPGVAEAFATEVAEILRDVPEGAVAEVEVRLGRAKLAEKIEKRLREVAPGHGFRRATVVLETGVRRELL